MNAQATHTSSTPTRSKATPIFGLQQKKSSCVRGVFLRAAYLATRELRPSGTIPRELLDFVA